MPAVNVSNGNGFDPETLSKAAIPSNGIETTRKLGSIPSVSYPSNALRFLENQGLRQTDLEVCNQSKIKLNIVIVGAGLGGLATSIALARRGHSVTVLEQAAELGEVGAGIQIPSNSSRLLNRWGVCALLKDKAVAPQGMTFRRWENGSTIGYTKLIPDFSENFGAPYYVVHRAHFHEALHQRAIQLGVDVRVGCRVIDYDLDIPSVQLSSGALLSADLVVAADGVKSIARQRILGVERPPRSSGFAAYRATVDAERIKEDPDISWLLSKPSLNIWIGEKRHVMTYCIAAGESFNMVLSHVDESDPGTWNSDHAVNEMRKEFAGWDPQLTKIIHMIEKTIKWPLMNGQILPTWISPSRKVLILGDAAHAMVPYMSQGAAMAVEDGAALAKALDLVSDRNEISFALGVFEKERMARTSQMQEASLANGLLWHFADGPEQRARDISMQAEVEGKHFLTSANQWSDPVTQWWAYGYDAEKAMQKAWEVEVSGLIREISIPK
ncbi:hypothetical protein B0O99DRAFT_746539 [Bisporella sp. PMI_857]|nr:hypothetical protein B0O99DRAFT_746539 [Bisporella sp. PMI_857]